MSDIIALAKTRYLLLPASLCIVEMNMADRSGATPTRHNYNNEISLNRGWRELQVAAATMNGGTARILRFGVDLPCPPPDPRRDMTPLECGGDPEPYIGYHAARAFHQDRNGRITYENDWMIMEEASGKIGRNDMCPCGSATKFKKCHGSDL